jgi:hypothetical protein
MTRGVHWVATQDDLVLGTQPKMAACTTAAQATPTLALRRWRLS